MSAALLRQALEFVDNEKSVGEGKKRKTKRGGGQDHQLAQKHKAKKLVSRVSESKDLTVEKNIKKLLTLSRPAADKSISEKLVERAIKGKPLSDKIETQKEEYKSVLFADETEESFQDFENELFCS